MYVVNEMRVTNLYYFPLPLESLFLTKRKMSVVKFPKKKFEYGREIL